MSARWIWWEATALLLALLLIEMGLVLLELRTAIVQDWFVTLAPLLWINASILVLFVFFRQLGSKEVGSRDRGRSEAGRLRSLLQPRFGAIRRALQPTSMRIAVLLIALGA
ncbi:MAG: hypothetical protein LN410_02890 [Candidatus Thermoplasmatota archaeon]|nr:hypothetical protein [Candidatus Thermoplasmatota archaeon]